MSDKKYELQTEELAVPEIRTGKTLQSGDDERDKETIVYEPLAVPEVHIKKDKN